MKRFTIQLFLFISPFIILIVIAQTSYSKSGGDLNKLGKISVDDNYRDKFKDDFNAEVLYYNFTDLDSVKDIKFDIFTIGDSFSDQHRYGYQNFLSTNYNLKILNFNFLNFYKIDDYRPFKFLNAILNGDLIEQLDVDYILLEVIERNFVKQHKKTDFDVSLTTMDIFKLKREIPNGNYKPKFRLSNIISDTKLFYKYNIGYQFDDRAFKSKVYRKKLSKSLFSANENTLLFYYQDIESLHLNALDEVSNLNNSLNNLAHKLKAHDIKLIVMPCADKYDLYYNYILNNQHSKNMFFDNLSSLEKNYYYLDTKKIFTPYLEQGVKDVYFADDTHWSPIASKIIANEINTLIEEIK